MKRTRNSTGNRSRAAAHPGSDTEVVVLLDDEDDNQGSAAAAATAAHEAAAKPSANTATRRLTATRSDSTAKAVKFDGGYEFPSSSEEQPPTATGDSDSDWHEQDKKPKQQTVEQHAQKPAQQRRRKQQLLADEVEDVHELIASAVAKRSSGKRPSGSAAAAAAAAADRAAAGSVQPPPSKRAKATAKPAAARSSKAAASGKGSIGRSAAGSGKQPKQATLQSKGFGALFFCASQPTSGHSSQAVGSSSQGASATAGAAAALTPADSEAAGTAAGTVTASPAAAAAADGASTSAVSACEAQWVDKHEPRCPEELLVHKKKVAEVQAWLQVYLEARAAGHCPTRVLLVTGPPGCGKSVTLRVLADSMGFDLTEWQAPVPTLWQDYQYQAGAGVGYSSKLDEFDLFVARCKFAALPLTCSSGSKQQQQQQSQQPLSQQQPSQQQQQSSSQSQQQMPPPKRRLPQLFPSQQQPSQPQQLPSQPAQQAPEHGAPGQQQQQQPAVLSQQQQQQQQQSSQLQPLPRQRPAPRPKLLLVDDLPFVGDAARRNRLAASLADLANTARCPVVVVATTEEGGSGGSKGGGYSSYGPAAAGMTTKGLHKDLLAVLDHAGAATINFNPVTANTITKALQGIADKEGFTLDPDTADGIAQAASGDLRNAVQSLQMLLLQQQPAAVQQGRKGKGKAPRRPRRTAKDPEAAAAAEAAKQKVAGQVARDQHLSVYHAVGKLLHYKRQQPGEQQPGEPPASEQPPPPPQQQQQGDDDDVEIIDVDAITGLQQVSSSFSRPPLRINPEAIIQHSGLEALQVTAFLAENYPHFFAEDAMEQAATAAAYLSDAGHLACHRSPVVSSSTGFWDEDDAAATTLQASAASSIAARGLLFSNTKPAASRWLPLKGPTCFLPDRAAAGNLQRLGEAVQQLQDSWQAAGPARQQAVIGLAAQLLHSGRQERVAQVLPFLQILAQHQSRVWIHSMLPCSWCHVWNGAVTEGRGSAHMQGPQAAAALQAAVAAAVADRAGGGVGSTQPGVVAEAASSQADASSGLSDEIETDDD